MASKIPHVHVRFDMREKKETGVFRIFSPVEKYTTYLNIGSLELK